MSRTDSSRRMPPRFLAFLILALIAIPLFSVLGGWRLGVMGGFDLAALVFIVSLWPLMRSTPDQIRRRAAANDGNRALLLIITLVATGVILVAVGAELATKGGAQPWMLALVVATLLICWAFGNLVFALHYAHLYYDRDGDKDCGGLEFSGDAEPDYWDFLYFSATLGMTFQTSDTGLSSPRIRRVALAQSFAAFIFNLGVLAFTINVLGSSSGG